MAPSSFGIIALTLMVEWNREGHLIRRFAGQGNQIHVIKPNQKGDEEEEYSFVENYPYFQEKENNVSFPGVLLGVEEESLPVYDTDVEDVIEEEERFVGKRGFGGKKTSSKTL
ncbi:hypothetical protein Tco_0800035 [Tanacetum coccineum]|uniref:Uncharacterized protein n=1 Tax=Tanacetum coccineum TaxID=301880 RepID=A0ABQ4ZV99_9ASTR